MKSSIIGKRNFATISILLALALINFIAIPPALAQCMLTPFQPPVGLIEFQVQPEMLTNMTQNGFTIRRTIDTPSTIQYTVDRVDQSSFTFLRNRGADTPNEIGAFTVSAAFVGQHGLLFTVRDGGLALKNPTREAVFF